MKGEPKSRKRIYVRISKFVRGLYMAIREVDVVLEVKSVSILEKWGLWTPLRQLIKFELVY